MRKWLLLLLLTLFLKVSTGHARCESPEPALGLQWGLGLQTLFQGNQPDFKLLAPGYLLTAGHRWGVSSLYGTLQYASSTGFSLVSFEASYRHILETPFLNLFGQAGGYYMNYGLMGSGRHQSVGGLVAIGLLIQFSPGIEFTAHIKGYIETESITAAGGTFLFHL